MTHNTRQKRTQALIDMRDGQLAARLVELLSGRAKEAYAGEYEDVRDEVVFRETQASAKPLSRVLLGVSRQQPPIS